MIATTSIFGVYAVNKATTVKSSKPAIEYISRASTETVPVETFPTETESNGHISKHYESSEIYEVIYFQPPEKNVYTLDDVYNFPIYNADTGEECYWQQIDFDGTGASMTVRNIETNDFETFDYECDYVDYGDEKVKCDMNIFFDYQSTLNEIITAGEHTATAIVITSDGECICHDFRITIKDSE